MLPSGNALCRRDVDTTAGLGCGLTGVDPTDSGGVGCSWSSNVDSADTCQANGQKLHTRATGIFPLAARLRRNRGMKYVILRAIRDRLSVLVYVVPILAVVVSMKTRMPIWLAMFFAFLPVFAVWCVQAIMLGHYTSDRNDTASSKDD